jgi:hypothetical protein
VPTRNLLAGAPDAKYNEENDQDGPVLSDSTYNVARDDFRLSASEYFLGTIFLSEKLNCARDDKENR